MKQKKTKSNDVEQVLYDQVENFFFFKKNLLINEILFCNRAVLETPNIVMLLMAESIYNVHTGKLLVAGGSAEGFKIYLQERYSTVFFKLRKRIDVLIEALIALKSRDLIEYLPTNESAQSYLDRWASDAEGIDSNDKNSDSSVN